jgi:hypothetical protein
MATQKRPLPATEIAKAETERTLRHIFDDPYVLQAFENLDPGGGGGLSQYPKTWVLSATDGDFATLNDVENSADVVNGDSIIVIGSVVTGGLGNLSKSLNFFLYPNAVFSLPASVTAANTYISGSMSAVTPGPFSPPALNIATATVSGNLFISGVRVMRSAPSAQTLTVSGSIFSINAATWIGPNFVHSSGTTLVTNTTVLAGVMTLSSTTLYAINAYMLSVTRSGGTTMFVFNSRFGTLNISAASQTITMTNTSIDTTLTLPASVGTSKLRHVNAGGISAPSPVVINSVMGAFDSKHANVSFTNALVNVVGAAFL